MKQFGAFDAKTHFSEMLALVIHGEKVIITRHGNRVAMLIPFQEKDKDFSPYKKAINAIKNLRKGVTLGKELTIKEMREEGRR